MLDLIGTTSRIWRTIIMWDEAINASPIEQLEKRVAALEQEARIKNEQPRTYIENKHGRASSRAWP